MLARISNIHVPLLYDKLRRVFILPSNPDKKGANFLQRLGLIGQKISYSLSPRIHRIVAEELGISAEYQLFDLTSITAASFLHEFFLRGGRGLNVTTPFKKEVADLCSNHISAVNTVVWDGQGYLGYNFDGPGFRSALHSFGVFLGDFSDVVFLGNGGAVLALLTDLGQFFPDLRFHILRRNSGRDGDFAGLVGKIYLRPLNTEILAVIKKNSKRVLLVQASRDSGLLSMFGGELGRTDIAVDLNYQFPGADSLSLPDFGLKMLIAQAQEAQLLWWRKTVDSDFIWKKLRAEISS